LLVGLGRLQAFQNHVFVVIGSHVRGRGVWGNSVVSRQV
jgi:hypothetical protein